MDRTSHYTSPPPISNSYVLGKSTKKEFITNLLSRFFVSGAVEIKSVCVNKSTEEVQRCLCMENRHPATKL
ncbi:hypothetical protein C5167_041695 [Papaver somniferum]|nr:hypothetical protein C5167_041695 [Papaver somniferum]